MQLSYIYENGELEMKQKHLFHLLWLMIPTCKQSIINIQKSRI